MGEKKKYRQRQKSKSQQREKRKNKKKSKQDKNKQRQQKKKKNQKRDRSSSGSSDSSESQDSSRSRQKKTKKKKKEKQKQQKSVSIPFPFSQPSTTPPSLTPLATIRPGNIVIPNPPPAPMSTVAPAPKPKTKQYHIFKLLPKLSIGCINIGRTIYSSKLLSQGFQSKMINQMCQQLEKTAKGENSKKMANMMSKIKIEINNSLESMKKQAKNGPSGEQYQNQFQTLHKQYQFQINKIRSNYIQTLEMKQNQ